MKIKLASNHALSQRHRFELKYFITEGHLDHWVYSTPESPKRIETILPLRLAIRRESLYTIKEKECKGDVWNDGL